MDFGLFCLMNARDPKKKPEDVYRETVEQVKLAEDVGFSTAWFAEHHFSSYSLCPSPIMVATWCAGQTKRIKLAPGVLVLPLYEPRRLVQDLAMLDIMSGGRMIVGLGTGYQSYEFERFGVELKEAGDRTMEYMDIIEQALTTGQIGYDGKYYKLPGAKIAVMPVHRPEVYMAGVLNHPGIRKRVAENSYVSMLQPGLKTVQLVMDQAKAYGEVFKSVGKRPEDFPLALNRFACVSEDRNEMLAAAEHYRYVYRSAMAFRFNYVKLDGFAPADMPGEGELPLEEIVSNGIAGPPELCAEKIVAEVKLLNPTHYMFFIQLGALPHKNAMRTIERLGKEVFPLVRKALPDLDRRGPRAGLLRDPRDRHAAAQ